MITTAETDTALRGRVRDLYDAYYDTLDDVRLSDQLPSPNPSPKP